VDKLGHTSVSAVEREGSPDSLFAPPSDAAESNEVLQMNVIEDVQQAWAENDWIKEGVAIPELGTRNYVWDEVDSSEWNRKD
jgi:hypothetical protein